MITRPSASAQTAKELGPITPRSPGQQAAAHIGYVGILSACAGDRTATADVGSGVEEALEDTNAAVRRARPGVQELE